MLPDLNTHKVVVAVALIVGSLYLVLAVGRALTKQPVCDEAWYSEPALNLTSGKGMGTTVLEIKGSPLKGLDRHTYWEMPLFIVAQSAWYRAFGFGLKQLRLFNVLWGLVFLLSWFTFIRSLFGNRLVALLACTLLAIDFEIVNNAATGRSDMVCAALGVAGLATYVQLRRSHLSVALLISNSLIACSGMCHPNGFIYLVVFLVIVFSTDREQLRWSHLAFFALPYFVGAALWASYILEAPADFIAQFGTASHRLWGLTSPGKAFMGEVSRYATAYGLDPSSGGMRRLKVIFLLAGVAAVVGAVLNRKTRQLEASRLWLELTAVVFLILTVFEGAKQEWYLIHILPYFAVLLALLVLNHWRQHSWPRIVTLGLFVAIAVMDLLLLGRLIRKNDYRNTYVAAVGFLHQRQSSTPIMGSSELSFGLSFDRVIDDYRLGFYSAKKPKYIVVDPNYREMFSVYSSSEPKVYEHIQSTLRDKYRKIYDDGYYSIYELLQGYAREHFDSYSSRTLPSISSYSADTSRKIKLVPGRDRK
jgi:Dolichyl-phosphate-mannose-protein mannosyltransferase